MEPLIIIKDNFYEDPQKVLQQAKTLQYVQYEPFWYASAFTTKYGVNIDKPFMGFRYNDNNVIEKIENLIKARVDLSSWYTGGDNWNGAFHMKFMNPFHKDLIHHHYKDNDCENGYSGVVYLSQNTNNSGTKIWKRKSTNSIIGEYGPFFEYYDINHWDLYKNVQAKFNRIVLFKGNVFHSGDAGFGDNIDNCRLFQTFFFNIHS